MAGAVSRKRKVKVKPATKVRTPGVVLKLKAARVVRTQVLQERDPQDNRRNLCHEPFTKMLSRRITARRSAKAAKTMLLYVPPVISVAPMSRCLPTQSVYSHHLTPQAADVAPRPYTRFRAHSMSLILSPEPNHEGHDYDSNAWPEDLQELVEDWDNQGHLWEVIKWLSTSKSPSQLSNPHMVDNIRLLLDEWEETFENKCLQIMDWLGYGDLFTSETAPSKVSVEVQPYHDQTANQWSSMNDQTPHL